MNKIKKIIRFIKIYKKLIRNRKFWKEYYRKNRENPHPSNFAVFCLNNYLKKDKKVLELGCGNGRDAFFFASHNFEIVALDIENEEIRYLNKKNTHKNLKFIKKNFTNYVKHENYDYIYSRFTMHSISDLEEDRTIANSYKNLKTHGLFLIEARSIKDSMFAASTKLSIDEGETDHYRRFLNYENIKEKLKNAGFTILYEIETSGLAIYETEDPVIIRLIAQKRKVQNVE